MGGLDDLTEREWQLVQATYTNALEEIGSNEALGERRLQVLLTLMSAAGVTIGLVADSADSPRSVMWAASGTVSVVAVFGAMTVMRLVHRNVVTTGLIRQVTAIRKAVTGEESFLRRLWVRDPFQNLRSRQRLGAIPTRGGLVEFAAVCTALMIGAGLLFALLGLDRPAGVTVPVALAGSEAAWLLQARLINRHYDKEKV